MPNGVIYGYNKILLGILFNAWYNMIWRSQNYRADQIVFMKNNYDGRSCDNTTLL